PSNNNSSATLRSPLEKFPPCKTVVHLCRARRSKRKTKTFGGILMIPRYFGRSVLAALALVCLAASAFAQVPMSQHVVLVIDENSSFSDVMANMPWLVAEGNTYGYANNYHSDNGGSLFDYLWLASGSCHSAV